jgi:hypothetical protein
MCNECVEKRVNVFSAGAFKESVSDRGMLAADRLKGRDDRIATRKPSIID